MATVAGESKKPTARETGTASDNLAPPPSATAPTAPTTKEPTANRITGAFLVAKDPWSSSGESAENPSMEFEVWHLADRIFVSACTVALAQGCANPEFRELVNVEWRPVPGFLKGLPSLSVINLYGLPRSPFRAVGHEHNPPFGNPQEICRYQNLMLGTRFIASLDGSFPDDAWMVVRMALSHSGLPVDELYHWEGSFRRKLTGSRYGDTVVTVLPWAGGAAVIQGNSEETFSLVHVGKNRVKELLPPRKKSLTVVVRGERLIAVESASDQVELRVHEFRNPTALAAPRLISLPAGAESRILGVHLREQLEVDFEDAAGTAHRLTAELDEPYASRVVTLPVEEEEEERTEPTVVALPPPYSGDAHVVQQWVTGTRQLYLVQLDTDPPRRLLLSSQPTATVWTPSPTPIIYPTVPKCDSLPSRSNQGGKATPSRPDDRYFDF